LRDDPLRVPAPMRKVLELSFVLAVSRSCPKFYHDVQWQHVVPATRASIQPTHLSNFAASQKFAHFRDNLANPQIPLYL
jgi:hypothetical protein